MSNNNPNKKRSSGQHLALFIGLAAYLTLANWITSQYLAKQFLYSKALGGSYHGLYAPFSWFGWALAYYRLAPITFFKGELVLVALTIIGLVSYVLLVGFRLRNPTENKGIHGTASFATEADIIESGLLPKKPGAAHPGVFVGGFKTKQGDIRYLRHNGPEHVAVIAPTRSGKGVGIVIPTLLSWPESVVINDQKGELFALTAAWRSAEGGNTILKFDPASEYTADAMGDSIPDTDQKPKKYSARFNPLDEIRIGTVHEVGDVQNIVTIIVDPEGKGLADHWAKTSHHFLTGLVLYLKYDRMRRNMRPPSLADLSRALASPLIPIDQLYDDMINNRLLANIIHPCSEADQAYRSEVHPVIAHAGRAMVERAPAERGSVLSTAQSFLTLYQDPLVAANISCSDFSITDLMDHTKPVSLYIIVRAEDKDRLKPLMRLIINQIVRVLLRADLKFENGRQLPPHKHRLLLMLDEFPSYGKLEVFEEALSYIAGYGIKACLIMQDISQLKKSYGQDESITSNCHVRSVYAPNRIETAKWASDYCGITTVVSVDISTSGSRFGMLQQSASRHIRESSRPLMTPDEITKLKAPVKDESGNIIEPGEMLVFAAGSKPILGAQSLYFFDQELLRRSRLTAPAQSQQITILPGRSDSRFCPPKRLVPPTPDHPAPQQRPEDQPINSSQGGNDRGGLRIKSVSIDENTLGGGQPL